MCADAHFEGKLLVYDASVACMATAFVALQVSGQTNSVAAALAETSLATGLGMAVACSLRDVEVGDTENLAALAALGVTAAGQYEAATVGSTRLAAAALGAGTL